jgi:hypothetical protein
MTSTEAVQTIATALAAIEKRNRQNIRDGRELRAAFKAVSDNGDLSPGVTSANYARLTANLAAAAARMLEHHADMTSLAQMAGIDMPPLEADEDDGEIGILSGGR